MIPTFREWTIPEQLGLALLVWSLAWMAVALLGLSARPSERWRGFWLMSGLWVVIDAAIGMLPFLTVPLPADELRRLLYINCGLDVGYVLIGGFLLTRPKPFVKGFGWAMIVQGLFLLILDLVFAQRM